MLTTDHNGMIITTGDRVEVSLEEKARSAGRIRASVGGQMSRRDQVHKMLRCRSIEVTQEIWEAYRSSYSEESTGVPF